MTIDETTRQRLFHQGAMVSFSGRWFIALDVLADDATLAPEPEPEPESETIDGEQEADTIRSVGDQEGYVGRYIGDETSGTWQAETPPDMSVTKPPKKR